MILLLLMFKQHGFMVKIREINEYSYTPNK